MGGAACPLHDAGNDRSIERGSDLQAARRGSLTTPAKPAGERESDAALTPRPGTRSLGGPAPTRFCMQGWTGPLSAEGSVDVVDSLVDQLLLEGCATGCDDVRRRTDPAFELGAGQRVAFDTAVERVVIIDATGKFLTEQPLVKVLRGYAAQVVDQGGPDNSIGDPALVSVASDLVPILYACDTPVEGHFGG